jgi:hypothetical protein
MSRSGFEPVTTVTLFVRPQPGEVAGNDTRPITAGSRRTLIRCRLLGDHRLK